MSEALKLADVLISVRLDTTAYKKQIAGLSRQTPQIAQNNKAMITGLRQEIAMKKAVMRLDQQRERMLGTFSKVASMGAVGAVGMVGGGLKAFLQSTDPAARKLNASLAKLKTASWQLMANIGKVANAKWNITGNVDKLVAKIKSIKPEDIDKMLNIAKVTIMVAGFAKIAMYAMKIKDYFETLSLRKMMLQMAELRAGGGLGTALSSGVGAGVGAGIGRKGLPRIPIMNKVSALSSINAGRLWKKLDKDVFGRIGRESFKPSNFMGPMPQQTTGGALKALSGVVGGRVGGKIGVGGVGLLASLGIGIAVRAFKNAGITLVDVLSAVATVLDFVIKSFESVVEVLGTLTDIIGSFIGSLFMVVKDAMAGNMVAFVQDLKGFDNPLNNFSKMSDNLGKIWDKPKFDFNLGKAGTSETGSFQDLNSMFQKMFEENYQKLAVEATDKNTQATIENTAALQKIVTTPQTQHYTFNPKQSGAESVYNNTGFMGSTITGANTVSRVTF